MSDRTAFFNAQTVQETGLKKDHTLKLRILKVLFAYVNHREKIITQYGGHMTAGKLAAIERVRNYIEHYKSGKAVVVAKIILQLRPYLEKIMPGRSSKYYEGDVRRLEALMNECAELANS